MQVGGLFGINGGYNYQLGDGSPANAYLRNIVVGLEIDSSFPVDATAKGVEAGLAPFSVNLVDVTTIRGRVGYAFDRVLLYPTAGIAIGYIDTNYASDLSSPRFAANSSQFRLGWTAGGGIEYAVAQNWTVKAEALYIAFPDIGTHANNGISQSYRTTTTDVLGRLGVNYKF